jgi:hypothetical protein
VTAYEICEFVSELPTKGIVRIDTDDDRFDIELDGATFESVSESTLKFSGTIGVNVRSEYRSLLIDTGHVNWVEHIPEGRA